MENESPSAGQEKSKWPLVISVGILAAVVILYLTVPSIREFLKEAWEVLSSEDKDRIHSWVGGFGWLGPLIIVLAMIFQMFLFVIPTILLMVVAITAYGPVWGSLLVFGSVFAASSVGYTLGRYLGEQFISKIIGPKSRRKVTGFIEDYGFWAVLVTRLNPFLSNDAISFAGGFLRMGYIKFISATLIGIAPLTILLAIAGRDSGQLKTVLLWSSLISLAGLGLYIWWDKRQKNKVAD